LDDADPAATLLAAAALLSSARRAGTAPASVALPSPAAADSEPELSALASAILADALRSDPDLAADLLTAAAQAGRRAAPPVLPALLDAAVRHRALRGPACAVLGERGRWLAAFRDDWRRVIGADNSKTGHSTSLGADNSKSGSDNSNWDAGDGGDAAGGGGADGPDEVWRTGGRADRRAWLAALRRHDPATARDQLARTWDTETGDDRAGFLAVLQAGLSP